MTLVDLSDWNPGVRVRKWTEFGLLFPSESLLACDASARLVNRRLWTAGAVVSGSGEWWGWRARVLHSGDPGASAWWAEAVTLSVAARCASSHTQILADNMSVIEYVQSHLGGYASGRPRAVTFIGPLPKVFRRSIDIEFHAGNFLLGRAHRISRVLALGSSYEQFPGSLEDLCGAYAGGWVEKDGLRKL